MRSRLLIRPSNDSYDTMTLVFAVGTVLLTRLILELTGYPQLGGSTLHIAHVLWGGLLMLVAGRMAVEFYGEGARRFSAALLGIGFGLFVDEVGKFVTQDNDYFYRPAASIIYVTFILFFFGTRVLRRLVPVSNRALMCEAIDHLQEVVRGDFEPSEKVAAMKALDQVISSDKYVEHRRMALQLRDMLERSQPIVRDGPSIEQRVKSLVQRLILSPASQKWLFRGLIVVVVLTLLDTAISMVTVLITVFGLDKAFGSDTMIHLAIPPSELTATILKTFWSVVAGFFLIRGLMLLDRQRAEALEQLSRGFTVLIVFVAVFTFYFNQFSATFSVLLNLALLGFLRELQDELPDGPGDIPIDGRLGPPQRRAEPMPPGDKAANRSERKRG